jgi:hypothetical protein
MGRYAEKTTVSSEKSRSEIEHTLRRYGATGFAYGWQSNRAIIQFEAKKKRVRFELPLPDQDERHHRSTTGRLRGVDAQMVAQRR